MPSRIRYFSTSLSPLLLVIWILSKYSKTAQAYFREIRSRPSGPEIAIIFPIMPERYINPRIIWANGFFEIIWEREQKEISEFLFNRIGRGNLPPIAICKKNIIKKADRNGWAKIIPQEIDAGSFDPNGGNIILTLDNVTSLPVGMHTVTLIVKNSKGQRGSCAATVIVQK